jgi:predicted DNA binding CopG/RHH family protein
MKTFKSHLAESLKNEKVREAFEEEKELLESYQRDEWQSLPNLESKSDRYRGYAAATFRKDKRLNIRISNTK